MQLFVVQLLSGLASAASLFLVASGLSLIFGVTRIVNFAHGAFFMLGAYLAFTLTDRFSGPLGFWGGMVLAAVAVGLVRRRCSRCCCCAASIARRNCSSFSRPSARRWSCEDARAPDLGTRRPARAARSGTCGRGRSARQARAVLRPFSDPARSARARASVAASCIAPAGACWCARRRRTGTWSRRSASIRNGCSPASSRSATFLAGLGGALQAPREAVDHTMDLRIIVEIFVVVVIGGLGSIEGAFVAAILVSLLNAFGILILPKISLVLVFLLMARCAGHPAAGPVRQAGRRGAIVRRSRDERVEASRPRRPRHRRGAGRGRRRCCRSRSVLTVSSSRRRSRSSSCSPRACTCLSRLAASLRSGTPRSSASAATARRSR